MTRLDHHIQPWLQIVIVDMMATCGGALMGVAALPNPVGFFFGGPIAVLMFVHAIAIYRNRKETRGYKAWGHRRKK